MGRVVWYAFQAASGRLEPSSAGGTTESPAAWAARAASRTAGFIVVYLRVYFLSRLRVLVVFLWLIVSLRRSTAKQAARKAIDGGL